MSEAWVAFFLQCKSLHTILFLRNKIGLNFNNSLKILKEIKDRKRNVHHKYLWNQNFVTYPARLGCGTSLGRPTRYMGQGATLTGCLYKLWR